MSSGDGAAPPRPRTPRTEGMANMVEATIRLLRTQRPEDITVRDVAAASGHHHRFVQAWFGGKVGLFRAVFDEMTRSAASEVRGPSSPHEGLLPDARVIASLMNWLMAADPGSLDGRPQMPILERVTEVYGRDFGLEPDVARLMALRAVATTVAVMLFRGPLGVSDADVKALTELEVELALLLGAARTPSP